MTKNVQKMNRHGLNNSGKYHDMFGISLFGSSTASLLNLLLDEVLVPPVWIATVNPEFVMNALKDRDFLKILLSRTSVNVVDGIGLAWAREVETRIKTSDWGVVKVEKRLFWGAIEGLKILGGGYKNLIITGVELVDVLCKSLDMSRFSFGWLGDRGQRTRFFTKISGLKWQEYMPAIKWVRMKNISDFELQKIDYLFVAYAVKSLKKSGSIEIWRN
jgi:hypothetical protein